MLVAAPAGVASAQPAAEACPPQEAQPAADGQQQCANQPPGMPDLPDLPQSQNRSAQQGRLSDTNCWMYPEGPEWFPPGTAPRPVMTGTQVWPCYYVLNLQPTVAAG